MSVKKSSSCHDIGWSSMSGDVASMMAYLIGISSFASFCPCPHLCRLLQICLHAGCVSYASQIYFVQLMVQRIILSVNAISLCIHFLQIPQNLRPPQANIDLPIYNKRTFDIQYTRKFPQNRARTGLAIFLQFFLFEGWVIKCWPLVNLQ